MDALKSVILRFLLELGVLAAIGYWGFRSHSSTIAKIGLGTGGAVIVAVVWGAFGAPGSRYQLHDPARLGLEVVAFGVAVGGLWTAGRPAVGIAFGALAVVNRVQMYTWSQ